MRTIKRRVGSLVLKIEKNGLQILVQREILHKYSCIRAFFFQFGSYPIYVVVKTEYLPQSYMM